MTEFFFNVGDVVKTSESIELSNGYILPVNTSLIIKSIRVCNKTDLTLYKVDIGVNSINLIQELIKNLDLETTEFVDADFKGLNFEPILKTVKITENGDIEIKRHPEAIYGAKSN